jgi:hypothetical protein
MTNENESTTAASKQFEQNEVDGKSLFYLLREQGHYVWEVGRKYYLWINDEIVDIEKIKEMLNAISVHCVLKPHQILTGGALYDFVKIGRMKSLSFAKSVKSGNDREEINAYKKIKQSVPKSREFFRSWVLKYVHPQS